MAAIMATDTAGFQAGRVRQAHATTPATIMASPTEGRYSVRSARSTPMVMMRFDTGRTATANQSTPRATARSRNHARQTTATATTPTSTPRITRGSRRSVTIVSTPGE